MLLKKFFAIQWQACFPQRPESEDTEVSGSITDYQCILLFVTFCSLSFLFFFATDYLCVLLFVTFCSLSLLFFSFFPFFPFSLTSPIHYKRIFLDFFLKYPCIFPFSTLYSEYTFLITMQLCFFKKKSFYIVSLY